VRGGDRIGLAHHVLDHQLLDSRGERCGKVDDVGIVAQEGGGFEVRCVLAGPGTLQRRCNGSFLRWLVGLAGDREVAVPWEQVTGIDDHVQLAIPAPDLGLAQGEERAARFLERVLGPDAHPVKLGPSGVVEEAPPAHDVIRLSSLLGRRAVDAQGRDHGTIHEIAASKDGRMLGEAAGNAWTIIGAATGRGATAARLGRDRSAASVWPIVRLPEGDDDPVIVADEPTGPLAAE
jgi:sporulation protein YlmC with PRC-barrel domain